jgi:hypothetical protein
VEYRTQLLEAATEKYNEMASTSENLELSEEQCTAYDAMEGAQRSLDDALTAHVEACEALDAAQMNDDAAKDLLEQARTAEAELQEEYAAIVRGTPRTAPTVNTVGNALAAQETADGSEGAPAQPGDAGAPAARTSPTPPTQAELTSVGSNKGLVGRLREHISRAPTTEEMLQDASGRGGEEGILDIPPKRRGWGQVTISQEDWSTRTLRRITQLATAEAPPQLRNLAHGAHAAATRMRVPGTSDSPTLAEFLQALDVRPAETDTKEAAKDQVRKIQQTPLVITQLDTNDVEGVRKKCAAHLERLYTLWNTYGRLETNTAMQDVAVGSLGDGNESVFWERFFSIFPELEGWQDAMCGWNGERPVKYPHTDLSANEKSTKAGRHVLATIILLQAAQKASAESISPRLSRTTLMSLWTTACDVQLPLDKFSNWPAAFRSLQQVGINLTATWKRTPAGRPQGGYELRRSLRGWSPATRATPRERKRR